MGDKPSNVFWKDIKLESYLSPCIKITPNVSKALLEELKLGMPQNIGTNKVVLERAIVVHEIMLKINTLGFTMLKLSAEQKKKIKGCFTKWASVFTRYICSKGLVSRMYKKYKTLNIKKLKHSIS